MEVFRACRGTTVCEAYDLQLGKALLSSLNIEEEDGEAKLVVSIDEIHQLLVNTETFRGWMEAIYGSIT